MLKAYGVAHAKVLDAQKGYRNSSYPVKTADGRMLNLIVYKRELGMLSRIRRADAIANFLAKQGYAVRRSADKRVMRLHANNAAGATRFAALYDYLPGQTIPWEAYTMDHIKLLGKTLSNLHHALHRMPSNDMPSLPDVRAESAQLLREMDSYFETPGVRQAMADKLGIEKIDGTVLFAIGIVLQVSHKLTDNQILHMDFVRSNILFSDEPAPSYFFSDYRDEPPFISGVLDFEKTAIGPAVFDVARSLAFLLVDCKYKTGPKIRKYFVESGYNKRGSMALNPRETELLKPLVRFFLLYDFYKFLRHNPYESLANNEHFVRTRDLLIKDGIIKFIL